MDSPIKNLIDNLEQTLNSFKKILSINIRNQRHLELSQVKMVKEQERHFDAIRWMLCSLTKEEQVNNPGCIEDKEDEDWGALKTDPIFGEDGWVEVPRNV